MNDDADRLWHELDVADQKLHAALDLMQLGFDNLSANLDKLSALLGKRLDAAGLTAMNEATARIMEAKERNDSAMAIANQMRKAKAPKAA